MVANALATYVALYHLIACTPQTNIFMRQTMLKANEALHEEQGFPFLPARLPVD